MSIVLHKEVESIGVEKVTKNDWNPNFVPKQIMDAIVDDIQRHGFIGTIVLQKHNKRMKRDYVVINGEHRFDALVQLGATAVPATVIDVDDKTAKLLTLRLNREHGELMPDKIADILVDLDPTKNAEFLASLTAIPEQEIKILTNLSITDELFAKQLTSTGEQQDPNKDYYTWQQIEQFAQKVTERILLTSPKYDAIIAITRGGLVPALLVNRAVKTKQQLQYYLPDLGVIVPSDGKKLKKVLVVDDIYDTGKTTNRFAKQLQKLEIEAEFCYMVSRHNEDVNCGKLLNHDKWVVFPWE